MLYPFGICSAQKNSILEQIQKLKKQKTSKIIVKLVSALTLEINSPDIFGVMGQGIGKLIIEKNEVARIEKIILLRYFNTLDDKSAKELLEETDCIIEITPKEYSVWEY